MGCIILDGKIGLIGAISTLIGIMVGAAIFILLGPLAAQTGPSLTLAFLLGAIPALFGSVYYMQLGSIFPSSGGSYIFASRLLNPTLGILAGFFMVFAGVGAVGMLALGFINYLSFYFTNIPVIPIALLTILFFFFINFLGIRFANKLQVFMVGWMVLALLIFIIFGFLHQQSAEFVAFDKGPFLRNGVSGLLMAAVLSFYSYAGYGIVTEIGGEIKNPQENTPLAIIISLVTVALIYMGVSYICTSIVPIDEFIGFSASIPMTASLFLPNWVVDLIAVGGFLAIFTTLNAIMLVIPQELAVMGNEGVISKLVTKKHQKFGTPYISLVLLSVVPMILIISGISETVFATMTIAGLLISGLIMGFSALKIFKKASREYEHAIIRIPKPLLITFSILGIISSFLFTVLAILDAPVVGGLAIVLIVFTMIYSRKKNLSILSSTNLNDGIDIKN
jgi:basic amino acid/polyamine antiporter, APA family